MMAGKKEVSLKLSDGSYLVQHATDLISNLDGSLTLLNEGELVALLAPGKWALAAVRKLDEDDG